MTFVWRTGPAMGRQLRQVRAVVFEANDTLVRTSGPHGGRSGRVAPAPLAVEAVAAVRQAGLPVGVVSAAPQVVAPPHAGADQESLQAQVGEMLGPFDTWRSCGHRPQDGCRVGRRDLISSSKPRGTWVCRATAWPSSATSGPT